MKNSKKIKSIAFFVSLALVLVSALPALANTAPVNILKGLTAKVSTTDGWFLENRPVANLTDGTGTLSDKGESAAWANPTTLSAVGGYSYALFSLSSATDINKVVIQQRSEMSNSTDIAVDVLLQSGGWKRVASEYGISDTYKESILTFSTASVIAVKVSFGGNADIAELEAYNDTLLTVFGGVKLPENEEAVIPDADATMNLLRGILAETSNSDGWFEEFRPAAWLTDGTGTVFDISWAAEYKNPASITPMSGSRLAYASFKLPEAKNVNRIIIQQNTGLDFVKTTMFAVDVKLEDGGWVRVAADYAPTFTFSGFEMTFEPVKAIEIKITGRTDCLHVNEIEAYCDPSITEYSGIKAPSNPDDIIPSVNDTTNIFLGLTPTTSNSNGWFEEFRPSKWINDGETGAYANPATVTNEGTTDYAWVRFDFNEEKTVNKIVVQQRDYVKDIFSIVRDIAVDVRLPDGTWKRVAAEYNIENVFAATVFTFEPVKATAVKITSNGRRTGASVINICEIEGYYDSTVYRYSAVKAPDNAGYGVPDASDMTNVLLNSKLSSSNYDGWFEEFRPLEWITDGVSGGGSSPATVTNGGLTDYAWITLETDGVKEINKIAVQQREYSELDGSVLFTVVKDLALDVRLTNGSWKRVAAEYNIDNPSNVVIFTFEPVEVTAVRLVSNGRRTGASVISICEIEGYYDKTVTAYSGIKEYDDIYYSVPDESSRTSLIRGVIGKSSNYDGWFEEFRPISSTTDGVLGNESSPATVTVNGVSDYAYIEYTLKKATEVNRVAVQQRKYLEDNGNVVFTVVKDIGIDILTENGEWVRVAAKYNINTDAPYAEFTFKPVKAKAIRVIANCRRTDTACIHICEVVANYDKTLTEYSGIEVPDEKKYTVPTATDMKNLFAGITPTSSNSDPWCEEFRPISWVNDGVCGPNAAPATVTGGKTKTAWIEFEFKKPTLINTVALEQRAYLEDENGNVIFTVLKDFAVDVLLKDGTWKRVASLYNYDDKGRHISFTFERVEAVKVRVYGSGKRDGHTCIHVVELAGYYDTTVEEYTGVNPPDNSKYVIPASKNRLAYSPKFDSLMKR